jgi:hypothetical protein
MSDDGRRVEVGTVMEVLIEDEAPIRDGELLVVLKG